MKASQLIEALQKAIADHGDLTVVDANGWDGLGHWMLDAKVNCKEAHLESTAGSTLYLEWNDRLWARTDEKSVALVKVLVVS